MKINPILAGISSRIHGEGATAGLFYGSNQYHFGCIPAERCQSRFSFRGMGMKLVTVCRYHWWPGSRSNMDISGGGLIGGVWAYTIGGGSQAPPERLHWTAEVNPSGVRICATSQCWHRWRLWTSGGGTPVFLPAVPLPGRRSRNPEAGSQLPDGESGVTPPLLTPQIHPLRNGWRPVSQQEISSQHLGSSRSSG